ncbi:MAG TPA: response regulator [Pararhizobium sp.]|uniref:response regulator n=1 Tax=Pararhizobium sp. TaxID=1977563 RepID=UPI002D0FE9C7|nr:response regulator [Pararhizobium sp.]HTO33134.1 response regulator [Pararhizobium sp.]
MRLLLVEDDILLGRGLVAGLSQGGFATDWVQDGEDAEVALETADYDAVVLDLGLPRLDGLSLLRRRRTARDRTPVLVLTARDTIADRISGLDAGGDDYLIKPFDLAELQARLRALIRRSKGVAAPVLVSGRVTLDPAGRNVTLDGLPVSLSNREFAILHDLMQSSGRVLTRQQLEERVYGWSEEIESNTIEVHIHNLRRKLFPEVIRTLRGVGYMVPSSP